MTILKSLNLSHRNEVYKNQFHNGIDFSQEIKIDSVESMPEVLKSLKILALGGLTYVCVLQRGARPRDLRSALALR